MSNLPVSSQVGVGAVLIASAILALTCVLLFLLRKAVSDSNYRRNMLTLRLRTRPAVGMPVRWLVGDAWYSYGKIVQVLPKPASRDVAREVVVGQNFFQDGQLVGYHTTTMRLDELEWDPLHEEDAFAERVRKMTSQRVDG